MSHKPLLQRPHGMIAWLWLIIFWSSFHLLKALLHKKIPASIEISSGPCWLFVTIPFGLKLPVSSKKTLTRLYDIGCLVAVASVYLCQALLVYWTIQAIYHALPVKEQTLVKRASLLSPHASSGPSLLIPGVTLPFDQIWSLLLGGTLAGLSHEFIGHALACSMYVFPYLLPL